MATPGCCVLIGGGGMREAEDTQAAAEPGQRSVRTGMVCFDRFGGVNPDSESRIEFNKI